MVKQKETNPFSGLSDKLRALRDERLVLSSRVTEIDNIINTVSESLNGVLPIQVGVPMESTRKTQKPIYLNGDDIITPFKGLFLGSRYVYHAHSRRVAHISPGHGTCALRPFGKTTKKVMLSIYPDNKQKLISWLGKDIIHPRSDGNGDYVLLCIRQIQDLGMVDSMRLDEYIKEHVKA